jgi:hypothetical protein
MSISSIRGGIAADATTANITSDSFGTAPIGTLFAARAAGGTRASPTATPAGTNIFQFATNGFNGSSYTSAASIQFVASDNFATSEGTFIAFRPTPVGGIGTVEAMRAQAGVMIGTTVDPGAKNLNVAGCSRKRTWQRHAVVHGPRKSTE